VLDARGRAELERALKQWQAAIERVARASAERLARSGEPAAHECVAVVMRFDVPAALGDD
jgi:hypothetical protein